MRMITILGSPHAHNRDEAMMSEADEHLVEERVSALLHDHPPAATPDTEFWGAQFDYGLAWVHFPEGEGGLGVPPRWQAVVNRRIEDAGGSIENRNESIIAIGMAAGTLLAHASPEFRRPFLRPMFTMEEIWCQLFSEPGAGSDLAALATSATREGDVWIVNGQKVWNTLAHVSRWGLLVTRTDPNVAKHAGLTYFVLDMTSPGVDVRPLYQITGEAEFNEVHLQDVRVPDSMRLGDIGQGWSVAMTTLMNERVAIGGRVLPRGAGPIEHAIAAWRGSDDHDPVKRDRLIQLWIEGEALRLTVTRANENLTAGTPGPEGSTSKIHWAEYNKAVTSFAVDLLGAEAMAYPSGYPFVRAGLRDADEPRKAFLRHRANSIEGGTTEILKNVLGERILGLPGEPRVDKDIPWRDTRRS